MWQQMMATCIISVLLGETVMGFTSYTKMDCCVTTIQVSKRDTPSKGTEYRLLGKSKIFLRAATVGTSTRLTVLSPSRASSPTSICGPAYSQQPHSLKCLSTAYMGKVTCLSGPTSNTTLKEARGSSSHLFVISGAVLWNSLPCHVREAESLSQFKRLVNIHF